MKGNTKSKMEGHEKGKNKMEERQAREKVGQKEGLTE